MPKTQSRKQDEKRSNNSLIRSLGSCNFIILLLCIYYATFINFLIVQRYWGLPVPSQLLEERMKGQDPITKDSPNSPVSPQVIKSTKDQQEEMKTDDADGSSQQEEMKNDDADGSSQQEKMKNDDEDGSSSRTSDRMRKLFKFGRTSNQVLVEAAFQTKVDGGDELLYSENDLFMIQRAVYVVLGFLDVGLWSSNAASAHFLGTGSCLIQMRQPAKHVALGILYGMYLQMWREHIHRQGWDDCDRRNSLRQLLGSELEKLLWIETGTRATGPCAACVSTWHHLLDFTATTDNPEVHDFVNEIPIALQVCDEIEEAVAGEMILNGNWKRREATFYDQLAKLVERVRVPDLVPHIFDAKKAAQSLFPLKPTQFYKELNPPNAPFLFGSCETNPEAHPDDLKRFSHLIHHGRSDRRLLPYYMGKSAPSVITEGIDAARELCDGVSRGDIDMLQYIEKMNDIRHNLEYCEQHDPRFKGPLPMPRELPEFAIPPFKQVNAKKTPAYREEYRYRPKFEAELLDNLQRTDTVPGQSGGQEIPDSPAIRELVRGDQVIGDVSDMLDFAILGFPKCGTSTMRRLLNMYEYETKLMSTNEVAELVRVTYNNTYNRQEKFGIKSTLDLESPFGLINYIKYFPNIDFIVLTRHPVLWLQSYYNYRVRMRWPEFSPTIEQLIGKCVPGSPYPCIKKCNRKDKSWTQNVCTYRANFHHALSRLGKTEMKEKREIELLQHNMTIHKVKGRVFLMEVSQMKPGLPASENFSRDLSKFLGLREELPKTIQGETIEVTNEAILDAMINICEDQYADIRALLVEIGRNASEWIINYFLKSPDVVVSSPSEFVELIKKWGEDPCNDRE